MYADDMSNSLLSEVKEVRDQPVKCGVPHDMPLLDALAKHGDNGRIGRLACADRYKAIDGSVEACVRHVRSEGRRLGGPDNPARVSSKSGRRQLLKTKEGTDVSSVILVTSA